MQKSLDTHRPALCPLHDALQTLTEARQRAEHIVRRTLLATAVAILHTITTPTIPWVRYVHRPHANLPRRHHVVLYRVAHVQHLRRVTLEELAGAQEGQRRGLRRVDVGGAHVDRHERLEEGNALRVGVAVGDGAYPETERLTPVQQVSATLEQMMFHRVAVSQENLYRLVSDLVALVFVAGPDSAFAEHGPLAGCHVMDQRRPLALDPLLDGTHRLKGVCLGDGGVATCEKLAQRRQRRHDDRCARPQRIIQVECDGSDLGR
mmetsp:Transcript_27471/g.68515  ORF Transcript_27471/g.68515 Transcript_27471/m.68515 type:complete len:263 (-) Transcript_27471:354-1142(-)